MFKWINKLFHKKKVLFCDLDGTLINTKSGKIFPIDKDDWYLRKDTLNAIKLYKPDCLCIITNQGGIEKGFIKEEDFIRKIQKICDLLQAELGYTIIGAEYCISNDTSDYRRKPNPGMVEKVIKQYGVKRKNCLMIGDASGKEGLFSDSDKKCAENAKIKYLDVNDFVIKYGKFSCWYCKHLHYRVNPEYDWCDIYDNEETINDECIGLSARSHICESFNYKET